MTVPLGQLPTGFTAAGGDCAASAGQVRCTGVNLTAGQDTIVSFPVTLAPSVQPPATWTATGITVADADESVSVNGALALAAEPEWTLTSTITGPPPGTVRPGGTGRLVVVAHNDGPSDARNATFSVTAAVSTSFDPLTGEAADWCRVTSAGRAVCTVNLPDGADTPELSFPFTVDGGADPYEPLPGACVDSDGDPGCDDTLDPIVLAVPFDRQVALSYVTAARCPVPTRSPPSASPPAATTGTVSP